MADIISKSRNPVPAATAADREVAGADTIAARNAAVTAPAHGRAANPLPHLMPLVEMLFFAYRDFTGEADAALEAYGLGRAHHRVLHFVNRHPSIRVADLLDLLRITKQSLGRVLRKLVADQWIEQTPGADDRRERRLTLTGSGRDLANELATLQAHRIDTALREIEARGGTQVRQHVTEFLLAMVSQNDRAAVSALVSSAALAASLDDKPTTVLREPHE